MYEKIKIKTEIPGGKSYKILQNLMRKNGGWWVPHPLILSGNGKNSYCEDIDGNVFLDFASQVASNPLGYNHPDLIQIVKKYQRFPVKYAGQDFSIREHLDLIENLIKISPGMNQAFLSNSGTEAVENSIKIAMRDRNKKKFTISFEGAFHGRTLGALSLHHSNPIHRKGYLLEPNKKIPFNDEAGEKFQEIIDKEGAEAVGLVILEHIQGEGGYNFASKKMIKDVFNIARKNKIPYVADEVQSGLGRTGKWWSFENYGIRPDVFSSAKALQVGATIATEKIFPKEQGAISSTWGGGHALDLALGIRTIEIIKRDKLLLKNKKNGDYILKRLEEIGFDNVRGKGLMSAFDIEENKQTAFIIECAKSGLLILGAGERSIRIIPPYIINKDSIEEGLIVIERVKKKMAGEKFKLSGKICKFIGCGVNAS